jgi:hypothetical protein
MPHHWVCKEEARVANVKRVASALMGLLNNAVTDDIAGIQFDHEDMYSMREELGEAESATDMVNQIADQAEAILAIGRALMDRQEDEHGTASCTDKLKALVDGQGDELHCVSDTPQDTKKEIMSDEQEDEPDSVSDTLQNMMKAFMENIEKVLTSGVYFIYSLVRGIMNSSLGTRIWDTAIV